MPKDLKLPSLLFHKTVGRWGALMTLTPRDKSQRTWSHHTILRSSTTHYDLFSLSSPCNLYHNALFATCLEWYCSRLYSAVSISQRELLLLTASKGPGAVALEDYYTWHQANRYMQKIVKGAPCFAEELRSWKVGILFELQCWGKIPGYKCTGVATQPKTRRVILYSFLSHTLNILSFTKSWRFYFLNLSLVNLSHCHTHRPCCVSDPLCLPWTLDSISNHLLYCFQGDHSKMFL